MNADTSTPVSRKWLRPLTLVEWLVIIALIAVLIALLVPPVKWGASGFIDVPIRIFVFDVIEGRPIKGAHVAIIRYSPDMPKAEFPAITAAFFDELRTSQDHQTDDRGSTIITETFMTEVNYKSPEQFALLFNRWVVVAADGFEPVMTPVRHDTERTAKIRKRGELVVAVGLVKTAKR
ncbi:hypothetical protein [Planctomicrobium piriforme]|uniref:Uncharacterized protein n=1 Tax=Planctomicrobium piriforme TaxID=1576369 RepID=A0A1I3L8B7_9PLAN|nr:hypothetical protein [Planctomicrobium piriforme]SFI81003.1 hypothetical protein SAMN05421753_112174 [Planctomicrobium piriforme]